MALQAGWVSPPLLWSWLILLEVLVVDASYTLLHRLIRGERVYEAHRSHAYQRASRLVIVVSLGRVPGLLALIAAYAPLVLVVARLGAGRPDDQGVS